MTDYAGTDVTGSAGVQVLERTGAASGDTVAAGSTVLWRNTGAGAHVVTIVTNNTTGGLAVADRTITIPAGQNFAGKIPVEWGDSVTGKCAVTIDGTATEVKYSVLST